MIKFYKSIENRTKHGPGGMGGPGDCSSDCLKCEVQNALRNGTVHDDKPLELTISSLLKLINKIGGYMSPEDQIILRSAQEILDKAVQ
jgi:hypothetical protein